jgi:ribonuclease HI
MPPITPSLFREPTTITAHCDGGARGNPGPAGFGAQITDDHGQVLAEISEFLGIRTNNFAEYAGLLASLQYALDHGHRSLRVISDSELMVKQIQGKYKVNSPDLKPLWQEAKNRIAKLDRFEIAHALRHKNKDADRLANEAMDRGMKRVPDPNDRGVKRSPYPDDRGMNRGAPAERQPIISTPDPRLSTKAGVQSLPLRSPIPGAIPYPDKSTAPPPPAAFDPRASSPTPRHRSSANSLGTSASSLGSSTNSLGTSTNSLENCHPEQSEGPASLPKNSAPNEPSPTQPALAPTQPTMLRGFARDGIIHILGPHTLPNGTFVKIIPE